MIGLLFLDSAPDPPSAAVGIGVLIVLAIIVLALVSALIVGFVLLLVWPKRSKAKVALVTAGSAPQLSSPNQ